MMIFQTLSTKHIVESRENAGNHHHSFSHIFFPTTDKFNVLFHI